MGYATTPQACGASAGLIAQSKKIEAKRTDAKGQETRYAYDVYGRLTEVQHWAVSWSPSTGSYQFQEQTSQRVDYHYDSNPLNGNYSQNAWGRLAAVKFADEDIGAPFAYSYS